MRLVLYDQPLTALHWGKKKTRAPSNAEHDSELHGWLQKRILLSKEEKKMTTTTTQKRKTASTTTTTKNKKKKMAAGRRPPASFKQAESGVCMCGQAS